MIQQNETTAQSTPKPMSAPLTEREQVRRSSYGYVDLRLRAAVRGKMRAMQDVAALPRRRPNA